jgi:hypothetical protein
MVNLQLGGQMGYSTNLTEWINNQSYVRRNLICMLVEAPSGFQLLNNPEYWVGTLRSLVELHAMAIDGLNQTLQVDFAQTAVGGAGEQHEDFIDVKRDRSNVSFRWSEKYGMPVARFLSGWIRMLMMDPETKVAEIATLTGSAPTDMLADRYSATMLFMEPDPTHTKVVKAWLITNMMPKSSGQITGHRDLTQAMETVSHDVEFTGIAQVGAGVDAFAQEMLSGINLSAANPYQRPAFVQQISADVARTSRSYKEGVEALGSSALPV